MNKKRARLAMQRHLLREGKQGTQGAGLHDGGSVRAGKHGSVLRIEELGGLVADIADPVESGCSHKGDSAHNREQGRNEQTNGRGQRTHSEPLARIKAKDPIANGVKALSNDRQQPASKVAHGSLLDVSWLLDLLPPVDDDGAHMWLNEPQDQQEEGDVLDGHGLGLRELRRVSQTPIHGVLLQNLLALFWYYPSLYKNQIQRGILINQICYVCGERVKSTHERFFIKNEVVREDDLFFIEYECKRHIVNIRGLGFFADLECVKERIAGSPLGNGQFIPDSIHIKIRRGLPHQSDDTRDGLFKSKAEPFANCSMRRIAQMACPLQFIAIHLKRRHPMTASYAALSFYAANAPTWILAASNLYGRAVTGFDNVDMTNAVAGDDAHGSRLRFGCLLAGLRLHQVGQEQVGPLKLHGGWNAAPLPVGNALDTARLVIIEKLSNPGGAAKCVNELFVVHAHIKHRVDFNVNTTLSTFCLMVQHG